MTEDLTVRPYQPGDEKEIVQLLNFVFDGWPHLDINSDPLDYWRWKYQGNPLEKSSIAVIALNNSIISCHHTITRRIKFCDNIVLGATHMDFVVHPNFRGRGLSRKVGDLNDERIMKGGAKISYWITGSPILIARKQFPYFPHPIVNLVKIKDIDKQLQAIPVKNTWLKKFGFFVITSLNKLKKGFSRRKTRKFNQCISDISNFDKRIDGFWEEVSLQYDFIVERSSNFLNWRYCYPHIGNFVIKQSEEKGRINGYCVLRINRYRPDYPIGYIVDLLTLPSRPDVVEALIDEALQYFEENNINIINYQVVKGHPYERMLKRHGFIDSRIKIHLFYIPFEEFISLRLNKTPAEKVFLSWGDHDVLPVMIPNYK